jgi:hypothetical protein
MTNTAERAPVVQRVAQALLSLDEDALAENSTHESPRSCTKGATATAARNRSTSASR